MPRRDGSLAFEYGQRQIGAMRILHRLRLVTAIFPLATVLVECGNEHPTQPEQPEQSVAPKPLLLSVGQTHTCEITAGGATYCWGYNQYGQLGVGSAGSSSWSSAVTVSGDLTFAVVSAGYSHSCGLTSGGAAYCWGSNGTGQLGEGTTVGARSSPVPVAGSFSFAAISAGEDHTCALTSTGLAYCWGARPIPGIPVTRPTPVPVNGGYTFTSLDASSESSQTCAITGAGAAYCWGDDLQPVAVPGNLSFVAISAGSGHNCALTAAGTAYCWGSNFLGQLGDGTYNDQPSPVQVAGGLTFTFLGAGYSHTCGLTTDALVYCWGSNLGGELGDGSTGGSRPSPMPIAGNLTFISVNAGFEETCAITPAGMAYCWGFGTNPTPTAVASESAFGAVSVGGYHSCALSVSGAAFCWGSNSRGERGDGSAFRLTPAPIVGGLSFTALSAGSGHVCGLTSTEIAYCWGQNSYSFTEKGQLGDATGTDRSTPVAVVGGLTFAVLSAGGLHTCGVTSAGAAYCWGDNLRGGLGDGTTTTRLSPVAVSGGLTFAVISAGGGGHTCALTQHGVAYCWGTNIADGRLGDGTTVDRLTPTAVVGGLRFGYISAGASHTCAITFAGVAYCWGGNFSGQLGDGGQTPRSQPVIVSGGLMFAAISAGDEYTCGVTTAGKAYCWGSNIFSQLGTGTTASSLTPAPVVGGLTFTSVTANNDHTCGLANTGVAYCWGTNEWGQLGDGTTQRSLIPIRVVP